MNTIVERSRKMNYHMNMRMVFEAIQGRQLHYNWLITNIECNHDPNPRIRHPYPEYVWISGEELTGLVGAHEIQFIWGVFSGFPKGIELEEVLQSKLPYADGNPGFWIHNPQIQHPLAEIEIVAWDSTLTLLLSKDEEMSRSFRDHFLEAKDLNEYNRNS